MLKLVKKVKKKNNIIKKKKEIYKSVKGLKNIVIFHVFSTFNNTIITLTDLKGNTIYWSTCFTAGFKGFKKSTFYAAKSAGEKAGYEAFRLGYKNAKIFIKGTGIGRDFSIRGIYNAGINIISVIDVTSIPHNGCRPKKLRRT